MLRAGRRQCGRMFCAKRPVNFSLVELEADSGHSEQALKGEVDVL
jgi:hypothetical protein